ncbi:MAG: HD domain-containing phosphohydrolase [Candidatus Omnitrophota bacterium]
MGDFSNSYQWDEGKEEEKKREKPISDHPFSDIIKPHERKKSGDSVHAYMQILAFAQDIFEKGKQNQPVPGSEIFHRINELIDNVQLSDKVFLELIAEDSTKQTYRARHIANVCILSIEIGGELNFNKSRLCELAVGAFLHDIGISRIAELEAEERKFTKEELEKVRQHPRYGLEIVSKMKDLNNNNIYCTVGQHHERLDGTGYPNAIKDGAICEYAQIVGILDMYEAMTHWRPYRERMSSFEAMKSLMSTGATHLEPRYVEALINVIGLYPVGSWVELNTGEIAKVIEINKKRPLRPTVSIIYDAKGTKFAESRPIDISTHPIVYIKKVLTDGEMRSRFPDT